MDKKSPIDELSTFIKQEGVVAIRRLVEDKISEQHFVDFKVTQISDYTGKTSLASNDMKNLAKGISGFGNSEGGLIVWGVNSSASDQASELKPVKGIDIFNALINRHISRVTIPHHNQVENIIVPKSKEEPDSGYLVTVIPKYDGLPLQVIHGHIFYIRAGESFVPTPHSVLAGLFGRKPAPNVFLMYTIQDPNMRGDKFIEFQIGIQLVNGGKGFAEDLFLNQMVFLPGGPTQVKIDHLDNRFEGDALFGVGMNIRSKGMKLAPEQRCQPIVINFKLKPPFEKDLTVDILVGAQGQMPYRAKFKHAPAQLQKMYDQFEKDQSYKLMKHFLPGEEKEVPSQTKEKGRVRV